MVGLKSRIILSSAEPKLNTRNLTTIDNPTAASIPSTDLSSYFTNFEISLNSEAPELRVSSNKIDSSEVIMIPS